MRIEEITCWALSESLGGSWRISGQTWNRINTVIVQIRTSDGQIGIGETNLRTAPRAGVAVIRDHLAPHIVGADPRDIEGIWWNMFQRGRPRGHTRGMYLKAMSGVDMALWDLTARLENAPLYRALRGVGASDVPVYASAVRVFDTPAEAIRKGHELVEAGHRTVKVMVGGKDLDYDLSVLNGLQDELDDDVRLCVDANSSFTTPEAVRFAVAAEDLDLLFFEEPVTPDNLQGYRRLRQSTSMPIAAGQSEFTSFGANQLVSEGLVDFYQPNAGRVGGPTGVRYMQHAAWPYGVLFSAHVGAASVVNGLCALHLAAASPQSAVAEYWEDDSPLINIARGAYPEVIDGHVVLSDEPGLGVELSEDALDSIAVEKAIIDADTATISQ